jgi:hypothetical protein
VEIYVTRCLVELRRTREDIRIIAQDKDMMTMSEVISEVHTRINRHRQLLSMMQTQILPYLLTNASDLPKESKLRELLLTNASDFPKESESRKLSLAELLNEYYVDLAKIDSEISANQP